MGSFGVKEEMSIWSQRSYTTPGSTWEKFALNSFYQTGSVRPD